jgi:ribosomal protein L37AE/L43A
MCTAIKIHLRERMAIEEKPSRNEDEYFAKMDADLMKERRARLDAERLTQERSSHYNKCPKCGCELQERDHNGVKIDQCTECSGMWLDKGELEVIEDIDRRAPHGESFIQSLFKLVR